MGRRQGGSHGYSPKFTSCYNYNYKYTNINTVNIYNKLDNSPCICRGAVSRADHGIVVVTSLVPQ